MNGSSQHLLQFSTVLFSLFFQQNLPYTIQNSDFVLTSRIAVFMLVASALWFQFVSQLSDCPTSLTIKQREDRIQKTLFVLCMIKTNFVHMYIVKESLCIFEFSNKTIHTFFFLNAIPFYLCFEEKDVLWWFKCLYKV